MIAIVRCYKHNVKPLIVETFEEHDEQTQKDAKELAAILSRKNKCEYEVLIDLSCVAVINDSKIETNE
jgi:hypothetical protein